MPPIDTLTRGRRIIDPISISAAMIGLTQANSRSGDEVVIAGLDRSGGNRSIGAMRQPSSRQSCR